MASPTARAALRLPFDQAVAARQANQERRQELSNRAALDDQPLRAFSSEVDTGSREENASKQEREPPFRFNRNGKGSRAFST